MINITDSINKVIFTFLLKNNTGVFEDVAFDYRVDDVIQNGRGTALSDILYRGSKSKGDI